MKRIVIGLVVGALLGIVCIVGAQVRSGFTQEPSYLFAFWYNRLLMGFVIGVFKSDWSIEKRLLRGALLGGFVSFAFYSSTGFADGIGFAVGIVYGMIIEGIAYAFEKKTRTN